MLIKEEREVSYNKEDRDGLLSQQCIMLDDIYEIR